MRFIDLGDGNCIGRHAYDPLAAVQEEEDIEQPPANGPVTVRQATQAELADLAERLKRVKREPKPKPETWAYVKMERRKRQNDRLVAIADTGQPRRLQLAASHCNDLGYDSSDTAAGTRNTGCGEAGLPSTKQGG